MKELEDLAQKVKTQLQLNFDGESVKYLEGFIERNKADFQGEERIGLINSCAAFLGQCIIENYGGQWLTDEDGVVAVAFDDKNKVYPFAKVSKQFENGLEDSVYSMYSVIPVVFKKDSKPEKKRWWRFWE